MNHRHSILLALLALTLATGCTTSSFGHRSRDCDPDRELARLRDVYDECRQGHQESSKHLVVDCDRAAIQIERLALDFPTHVPTLMTVAVIAYYDAHDANKAERYLDALFSVEPSHPEAAILRSRISIDQGNLPAAKRLLEMQISYAPDNAGLREAHSSVLYMAHDLEGARAEISAAEKLGAPAWRVAFNRGLIAEEAGQNAEAAQLYEAALTSNPDFKPARSRLAGMKSGPGYNGGSSPPGKAGGG
jgi:tetratricopeptide (TPR) repeat protein